VFWEKQFSAFEKACSSGFSRVFQPLEATALHFSASAFAEGSGATGRVARATFFPMLGKIRTNFSRHWKQRRLGFPNLGKNKNIQRSGFQGLEFMTPAALKWRTNE